MSLYQSKYTVITFIHNYNIILLEMFNVQPLVRTITQFYLMYIRTYILYLINMLAGNIHDCMFELSERVYLSQPPVVLTPYTYLHVTTDNDVCNETNPCAPNGNCMNSNGSFTCDCFTGYMLDPSEQNCSGKYVVQP